MLSKTKNNKIFIKDLTREELKKAVKIAGFPEYRGDQIFDEIYVKRTNSFDNMGLLPLELRDHLK